MTNPQQQYTQPQMPGYPQPYVQQPGFPQQGFPQPQYTPQQPSFPQPQYVQPQPAPQLASGSLDAFYQQPSSGGGAALRFDVGTRHIGIVSRPITNADIQQQTQPGTGLPAFFKDGRPKFVMKVPLQMQPSQDRPDGLGQWYVSGAARDELVRAMTDAGAPAGPPEAGAIIDIACTGTRPAGVGMNPAKVYQVRYQRPTGAQQPAPAPQPAQVSTQPPAAVQQVPPMQPAPVQAAPTPVPTAASAAPVSLTPEQQALLAKLTGQAAA